MLRGTMNILIVDDHSGTRDGLKEILAEDYPSACFGEAADAGEAMQRLSETRYDLVLLDINMPGRTGLDVLPEIKCLHPGVSVIMVSVNADEQYAKPCLKLGADAYISKGSAPETLIPSVRRILGQGYDFQGCTGYQYAR
jgi:two-component system invasion response regulator UvrY